MQQCRRGVWRYRQLNKIWRKRDSRAGMMTNRDGRITAESCKIYGSTIYSSTNAIVPASTCNQELIWKLETSHEDEVWHLWLELWSRRNVGPPQFIVVGCHQSPQANFDRRNMSLNSQLLLIKYQPYYWSSKNELYSICTKHTSTTVWYNCTLSMDFDSWSRRIKLILVSNPSIM